VPSSSSTLALLVRRRASNQQLAQPSSTTPTDLVRSLVAVQAQDWPASRWALALRLGGAFDDEAIERGLGDGAFIRTHAFRWTWQLIAPSDVRWILSLLRPRLLARAAKRHRDLGLDAKTLVRANEVIARALQNGPLTRADLAAALRRCKIDPEAQRLPHLLACAELEEIACSGPRIGKQPTWRLLDEVAPPAKPRDRADALRELALRYFTTRGPATLSDFMWWTSLEARDARTALEAAAPSLGSESIGGETYWFDGARPVAKAAGTFLTPAFDEYLVAYRRRDAVLDPDHVKLVNAGGGLLGPCIVHDGRIIGTWRRATTKQGVSVELSFFEPRPRVERAIREAEQRYLRFITPKRQSG